MKALRRKIVLADSVADWRANVRELSKTAGICRMKTFPNAIG